MSVAAAAGTEVAATRLALIEALAALLLEAVDAEERPGDEAGQPAAVSEEAH